MKTWFFLGSRKLVAKADIGAPIWQDKLYIFMSHLADDPSDLSTRRGTEWSNWGLRWWCGGLVANDTQIARASDQFNALKLSIAKSKGTKSRRKTGPRSYRLSCALVFVLII